MSIPCKRIVLVSIVAVLAGCGRSPVKQVILAGSTSVQPFAEMVSEKFMETNPDIRVVVQGGGSTAGIQAVREGAAGIGMVSRSLSEQENDLRPIIIARDGIAVIVHQSNNVSNLTGDRIRAIFSGKITDWSEVGGVPGAIRAVTREEGSGTRGTFDELLMHGDKSTPRAMVQDSNGSMREVIANDPGGIGYISLDLVNASVKAVGIDGVSATRENARNGAYAIVRPFLFVTKTEPDEPGKQFIGFVLSEKGQSLLEEEGLIRAK